MHTNIIRFSVFWDSDVLITIYTCWEVLFGGLGSIFELPWDSSANSVVTTVLILWRWCFYSADCGWEILSRNNLILSGPYNRYQVPL